MTGSMARSSAPAIVADGLAAAYRDRLIWRDATFRVNTGEFVAVLGPNGSGKSTLLRLLLGLLPPAAGSLQVLGERPHRGNADIGYVPQRRNIDRDLPVRGRDFVHLGIDGDRWGVGVGNAANNHQRFVRGQLAGGQDFPRYEQEEWVRVQGYQAARWADLIDLWRAYNTHLLHVARGMTAQGRRSTCRVGGGAEVTLEWLFGDYVDHLEHHLRQMLGRWGAEGA